jgi:hypothetical protein
MRFGGLGVGAALAVLALGGFAPSVQAASGLEPGVHVDPGSPAAKEYALPLNQARQTGSEPSSQTNSEGALFGAGIKPPGAGGSTGANGRRDAHPATGGVTSTRRPPTGSGSQPALASAVLRAERSSGASGGEGSLLALLGGGVAILVLGGFGGTVLRHSRRPTPSP